jgi:hypothetical protein
VMDYSKLRTSASRGVFTNGEDFREWDLWRQKVTDVIHCWTERQRHKSSSPPPAFVTEFLCAVGDRREEAVYVILHDMTHDGASWEHLTALGALVDERVVPPEHAGRLFCQIADWLLWYECL